MKTNNTNKETRAFDLASGIEIREKDGQKYLFGYAVKYNQLSRIIGWGFRERFVDGAFDSIINSEDYKTNIEADTVCYYSHSTGMLPLGRRSAGTLEIGTDETGLWYECQLPKTTFAADLEECLKRGDIRHSSFEFIVGMDGKTTWVDDPEQGEIRTVEKVQYLGAVNPVMNPAYESSTAEVAKREFEAAKAERNQEIENDNNSNVIAETRQRENEARQREIEMLNF